MGKKNFLKCYIQRNSYMLCMVASWACEVTEILKQRSTEEASFV